MSSYTDDEIKGALLWGVALLRGDSDAAILRWLASEYPRLKAERCPNVQRSADGIHFCEALNTTLEYQRLKADAERYRHSRLQAWLESCVDDLVIGTRQAKESEFNAGYDQEIDAARGKEGKS